MTELPPEGLASRLATEADRCVREGQREKASELYARAAELTREALERAPKDAFKSRALFMVNIPMLLFKAQRYAEAEQAAREYMAAHPAPSAGVLSRLREVAFNSWQAQSVMQAEELESVRSIASCELSLEGGVVRWPTPLMEIPMPLNLTPKALAEVNKHRPTAIECVAAALAKAEELARLNPESDVYRQEREAARNEMLSLLSSK